MRCPEKLIQRSSGGIWGATIFGTNYDEPTTVQEDPETHVTYRYRNLSGTLNMIAVHAVVPVTEPRAAAFPHSDCSKPINGNRISAEAHLSVAHSAQGDAYSKFHFDRELSTVRFRQYVSTALHRTENLLYF